MTYFNLLLILIIVVFYSCNTTKIKDTNTVKQTIDTRIDTSKISTNFKNISEQINLNQEDIIQAAEKQIEFYKTATKEDLIAFLNISKERVNAISDKEFDKLVREGNAFTYEFLVDGLKKDKIEFDVLSKENNIFKVSFKEKGNDDAAMIMNFESTDNGLVVSKKRTND